MKRSFAFDVYAEIDSEQYFDEIPIKDLCDALRKRLALLESLPEERARHNFILIDSQDVNP